MTLLLLGSSSLDVVGRLDSDLQPGASNPARIRASYGGVARNVAENLARLGQPVKLVSVVGMDRSGDELLEYTAAAGVDVSAVLRTELYPTGFYMGVLDPRARLRFAVDDMRVMSEFTPELLRQHVGLFEEASLVFVDGNLSEAALKTAFAMAKKAKVPICADPASAFLATRLKSRLDRLHFITCNVKEAAALTGHVFESSDPRAALEAARALLNLGADIALVTLAEFGVVYASAETNGHIPAIQTPILDPTGAGDALTATILFGLVNEMDLDDAVRLGVSAASLTLRHSGAVLPGLTLEKLYEQLVI
ncbi:MAG: carbohydrate kinase family protein [Anaerolineales bacterium]|jgi:pseudouridine kinase|nr:carbohydrate kinase family protein [Anaerolineales bacterium]MDX9936378.1 carbohydrate kinase family protein [Anaerolineales bacterium]GER80981.1 ribokinase [Candidatus Denitrolinea symbiosum]